jgi:A/G-specific adenine glycosylase
MSPPKDLSLNLPNSQHVGAFQATIWEYFRRHARDMPWRQDTRPYYVLVSELMLQQTQVSRVIPKFEQFIAQFPDEKTLAAAPLGDVLIAWQGLGYNRRAKFLHQAARQITQLECFPTTTTGLMQLSGVGANTAGAIMNYAFNQPVPFVETNIRTALIEHFYPDGDQVTEAEFRTLAEHAWDHESPREWAWALMDYGSYLKSQGRGRLTQVKQYKKQSPLKGSLREMRGRILQALSQQEMLDTHLRSTVEADDRYTRALSRLQADGLIEPAVDGWRLTSR